MLEALQQRTPAEKENKIEEALVKSNFQKPKEAVSRITYEDSTLLSSGNDGLKRRKKPEKKQEETGLLSLQQNYAESGD
ncbi:hypothetical protein PVK06_010160 [Gossypium arboreum]|uniref:Uncharacterized protein n=1 Tax=Gossypium arboreum TaxID=29729 RepID=A0ABR0QQG1_GOSAR|nr:hypothetical protein PVK06_010160 [Gossypium arboreum]